MVESTSHLSGDRLPWLQHNPNYWIPFFLHPNITNCTSLKGLLQEALYEVKISKIKYWKLIPRHWTFSLWWMMMHSMKTTKTSLMMMMMRKPPIN